MIDNIYQSSITIVNTHMDKYKNITDYNTN